MMTVRRQPDHPPGERPEYTEQTKRKKALGAIAVLLVGLGLAGSAADPCEAALSVSIDTTALAGAGAQLDVVLLDGDLTPNNSVTISNLATDGALGAIDCSVGCTPAGAADVHDRRFAGSWPVPAEPDVGNG